MILYCACVISLGSLPPFRQPSDIIHDTVLDLSNVQVKPYHRSCFILFVLLLLLFLFNVVVVVFVLHGEHVMTAGKKCHVIILHWTIIVSRCFTLDLSLPTTHDKKTNKQQTKQTNKQTQQTSTTTSNAYMCCDLYVTRLHRI